MSGEAPSKSSARPAPVEQALAAYKAMWADADVAAATSDVSSPRLGDHASGAALRLLRYMLTKDRQEGLVAKGAPRLSPEVAGGSSSASATRVDIRDCFDDTHWLMYKLDGTLKNDVPGTHRATTATVQLISGQWKVTSLYLGYAGSCE